MLPAGRDGQLILAFRTGKSRPAANSAVPPKPRCSYSRLHGSVVLENVMNAREMEQCIENFTTCHATCILTIQHCLGRGGRHAGRDHIRLLADCAQICRTSADFMIRGSDLHPLTCGVCAEICQRCAEDCEQLADGDAEMRRCADTCRRCAESCRQ